LCRKPLILPSSFPLACCSSEWIAFSPKGIPPTPKTMRRKFTSVEFCFATRSFLTGFGAPLLFFYHTAPGTSGPSPLPREVNPRYPPLAPPLDLNFHPPCPVSLLATTYRNFCQREDGSGSRAPIGFPLRPASPIPAPTFSAACSFIAEAACWEVMPNSPPAYRSIYTDRKKHLGVVLFQTVVGPLLPPWSFLVPEFFLLPTSSLFSSKLQL